MLVSGRARVQLTPKHGLTIHVDEGELFEICLHQQNMEPQQIQMPTNPI